MKNCEVCKERYLLEIADGPIAEPGDLVCPRNLHMSGFDADAFQHALRLGPVSLLKLLEVSDIVALLQKFLHENWLQHGGRGNIEIQRQTKTRWSDT